MYGDDDKSTGSPEKYTKEQFQKMEKERYAEEARQNAERDKAIEKRKGDIQSFADKRSPESKAAAEQRMQEYKEGRAKSMEQFNANMQKISGEHDAKMKELRSTTKSGGSGAAGSGLDIEGKTGRNVKPKLRAGGMVSSASKRADGCAIKGKTKGKMV
jgi:hypothetical protein